MHCQILPECHQYIAAASPHYHLLQLQFWRTSQLKVHDTVNTHIMIDSSQGKMLATAPSTQLVQLQQKTPSGGRYTDEHHGHV